MFYLNQDIRSKLSSYSSAEGIFNPQHSSADQPFDTKWRVADASPDSLRNTAVSQQAGYILRPSTLPATSVYQIGWIVRCCCTDEQTQTSHYVYGIPNKIL